MMSLVKWKDSWIESSSIQEVNENAGLDALVDASDQLNNVNIDGMHPFMIQFMYERLRLRLSRLRLKLNRLVHT
jgi:hypothetical protein